MKTYTILTLLSWLQRTIPPVINACAKVVSLTTRVVDVCQRTNVWVDKQLLWYRFGKRPGQLSLLNKEDVE